MPPALSCSTISYRPAIGSACTGARFLSGFMSGDQCSRSREPESMGRPSGVNYPHRPDGDRSGRVVDHAFLAADHLPGGAAGTAVEGAAEVRLRAEVLPADVGDGVEVVHHL